MIILPGEQGSDQWFKDRLGIATASRFDAVMTTIQHKRSKSDYIYELAAEIITKKRQQKFMGNEHTERGSDQQDEAIAEYEFMFDVECEEVGFCLAFDGARYGSSPDALIDKRKGLEVKCPELKKHLEYSFDECIPKEHKHQVYGGLFVSGYDSWDFMSYHRDAAPFVIEINKNNIDYLKWSESFIKILNEFLEDLDKINAKIINGTIAHGNLVDLESDNHVKGY